MQELAAAIARGGLPACTGISLGRNPGSPIPVIKSHLLQPAGHLQLSYSNVGWDDAQGAALCEALRYAHAKGGLRKLKTLSLEFNRLGDAFVTSLVALLDEGGLASLETLELRGNAISERGMQELAAAIARGGLPACTGIDLDENPGSDAPVQEALAQRQK